MANTKTTSGGLNFTYPAKGRANFSALFDTLWALISAHDHTGSGNGKQLGGTAISANSIDETHIELSNNTYLEWANNAGSGTINGWKVTTGDILMPGVAIDFNSVAMTNVNIDSGAVDGATINGGTIGTSTAVTDLRVDNLKLDGNALSSTSGELTLADANDNAFLVSATTASAVNHFQLTNAATAGTPVLEVIGTDANVGMDIKAKGSGQLALQTPGGSDAVTVDSAGHVNLPLTSSFMATHSVVQTNATGNGTVADVEFTNEIYDQNADYNGTQTFTAPVTGRYLFTVNVDCEQTSGLTTGLIKLVTSNREYGSRLGQAADSSDRLGAQLSVVADMDASDTCKVTIQLVGVGADTADIAADGSSVKYSFSGHLLA